MEYVESLTFLDEIQDQIDEQEKDAEIVKKLYDLIEQYTVPTPPEDMAVYQVFIYRSLTSLMCQHFQDFS